MGQIKPKPMKTIQASSFIYGFVYGAFLAIIGGMVFLIWGAVTGRILFAF